MIQLNRGINLGGFLSQCVHEKAHYDSFILEEDIKKIKEMRYDHVRLPIDYEIFQTEAGDRIDEGFQRVHDIIGWTRKNDLTIILDLHRAYGYDFNDANDDSKNRLFFDKSVQDRFVDLWKDIATEYHKYDNLVFELLNEVVEEKAAEAWNDLIARTVAEIRKITADTRIIYGGIKWNSAETIKYLRPVTDPNTIITFHFYMPHVFTHQHAYWMPEMEEVGDMSYPDTVEKYKWAANILGGQDSSVMEMTGEMMDIDYIRKMVKVAVDSAKNIGAPMLYVGEYGVIDKAPAEDMLRWLADTLKVYGENNIGCAFWTYRKMDFGIDLWDEDTGKKIVEITTK
ncbi:MAG: glycoside hydrolase family 5 protein [Lachnospiraceae bacterium]|nr:glycoside hydrolase family 5 protein [Lachnospiraceae bacterium]